MQTVEPRIPAWARLRDSIQCGACGEMVMETRVRLLNGCRLCIPRSRADEHRM